MKLGGLVCAITGVFLIRPVAAQPALVTLGTQATQADGTVVVPVQLASAGLQVAAVQFDINFDTTVASLGAILGSSSSTASKTPTCTTSDCTNQSGVIRIVLVGTNQNLIPDGTLVTLSITPASSGFSGILNLANPIASDAFGSGLAVSSGSSSGTGSGSGSGTGASLTIVNGASYKTGAVAPGEIVALFQTGMLPATAAASDVSVTFNGVSAPLIYTGANQINAVTPFEISGASNAAVLVSYQSHTVAQTTLSVVAQVPGIFSANGSGSGQAVAINQDSTMNSASNPAARGSTVTVYATGGGVFTPSLNDGQILASNVIPTAKLAAKVSGGVGVADATLPYVGPAPGLIAGALQINIVIPANTAPGPAEPLLIFIGGVASQSGITLAVK